MTEHVEDTNSLQDHVVLTPQDSEVDDILKDPTKRLEILRKLGLPADPSVLTPSGKATGGGGPLPPPMWYPFPMFAPWNPAPSPHVVGPSEQPIPAPIDDPPVEDVVDLLDDNEALELVEYDPSVSAPTTWTPSEAMISFLEKHFNHCVDDSERDKILSDFPKPNAPVLNVHKLDNWTKRSQSNLRAKRETLTLARRRFSSSYRNLY